MPNSKPRLSPRVERELADGLLRTDFVAFTRRVFETVVPGERLRLGWHIEATAAALDEVVQGRVRRLLITVPPRHLKSIMCSVAFPAYVLGQDPTKKIVSVSYSRELVTKHALDFRHVCSAGWYRRLFPQTRIGEKNTEVDIMTTRRGGRLATSIDGTLTGRGGDYFIIDDPQKPEEALSAAGRAKVLRWFESTLVSRLDDKTRSTIIVVMQRLHPDDLAGELLKKGGWTHLNLPAIAEEEQTVPLYSGGVHRRQVGDVLDPIREPRSVLDELKASMGSMAFSAQYQQRPIPVAGNLVLRQWLKFYDVPPNVRPDDMIVTSWDTAMKAEQISDFSVGTTWLVRGNFCYLLDLVRGRFDFPTLSRAVLFTARKWPSATILVEDMGSGTSLIQQLRYENVAVIATKATQDKSTRLFVCQPMFESGSVFFPRHAAWLETLVEELLGFPGTPHDDQVDSISHALNWISKRQLIPKESQLTALQVF